MPTPIGHVLGGVAAGWVVAGRATGDRSASRTRARVRFAWGEACLFGALGAAPDLDLLFGAHSTYTHSIGAAALTALIAILWTRGRHVRMGLACGAAVASHVLLDWLGSDTTPPIGIMALWPFTREFYQSPFFLFLAISRRWWLTGFYIQNGAAALRELAILLPIAATVGLLRTRTASQKQPR